MSRLISTLLILCGSLTLIGLVFAVSHGQWFYEFRGCREEDVPELIFLVLGIPLSLIASGAGLIGIRAKIASGRAKTFNIVGTLCLIASITLVPLVAFEFGGDRSDACKRGSASVNHDL